MRIAICDDESVFRKMLYKDLACYASDFGYIFDIFEYSDGAELLHSEITFDLIFMDYQMKSINGIDTVSAIRKRKDNTKVVFVSSYKDVVFESMKVNTFRFLVKPIDKNKLFEALDSVIRENEEIAKIVVKCLETQRNVAIPENEIIYIQADNVYSTVVTANNAYIYINSIGELQKKLRGDYFYRTNRSYIVNFNYISSYSSKEITFVNGHKALISKLKFKEFKTSYLSFIRRKSIGGEI